MHDRDDMAYLGEQEEPSDRDSSGLAGLLQRVAGAESETAAESDVSEAARELVDEPVNVLVIPLALAIATAGWFTVL